MSSSSDLLSVYAGLQVNNYVSVAIIVAVVYDYTLLISKEVEYIWSQPWTWISFLYALVRYAGLLQVVPGMLFGSSLIPGTEKICITLNMFYIWAGPFFLCAADLAMILRLNAMYQRSRKILGVLLMLYIPVVALSFAGAGISTDPRFASAAVAPLLDVSICVPQYSNLYTKSSLSASVVVIVLNALMCALVIIQFLRESLSMYRVTKQWKPNQYMRLLAREGVLYFVVNFVSLLCSLLGVLGSVPMEASVTMFMMIISNVPLFVFTPRFILSVRELYARDLRGRFPGAGIDTGFGLSLPTGNIGTVIEFARNEPNEEIGGDGELPMTEQRMPSEGLGVEAEHGSATEN